MTHLVHTSRGTVLFDDCPDCDDRARTLDVDDETLVWLADRAAIAHRGDDSRSHALSMNERRAISLLRYWARVVFKSGISEEVSR